MTLLSNEEAFCEAVAVTPDGNTIVGSDMDTLMARAVHESGHLSSRSMTLIK